MRNFLLLATLVTIGCSEMTSSTQTPIVTSVQAMADKASQHGDLNIFITLDTENALKRAAMLDALDESAGSLHGKLIVVKDNIHVVGMPNTAGTPALLEFSPSVDSPVIACLRDAGAIIVGKTNMHELAAGITSNNAHFGAVGNAHNPAYFAGGSSGGTASAIGAGIVDSGLGTDTGGSVRIPASLNGIVGFRPSTGRYSTQGVTPLSATRDVIGPQGKDVATVMALDQVMTCGSRSQQTAAATDLTKLRIGVPKAFFFANLDPQTQAHMDTALELMAAAGVTLIEADLENLAGFLEQTAFPIVLYEAKRDLINYLHVYQPELSYQELVAMIASPDVKGLMASLIDGGVSEADYLTALSVREELRQAYASYFAQHQLDAIVFPTTPLPASPITGHDETIELNGQQAPTFLTYIRNTDLATLVAAPGLSLPIGKSQEGLPIGLEIDGLEGQDQALLSIGAALEIVFAGKW